MSCTKQDKTIHLLIRGTILLLSLSTNCWEIHYRKIISLSRIFETIDMWDDRDWKDIRILDQHLYSLCQGRRKDIYMSDKQLVNESWYDSFTKGWIILLQLLSCLLDEANREQRTVWMFHLDIPYSLFSDLVASDVGIGNTFIPSLFQHLQLFLTTYVRSMCEFIDPWTN